MEQYPSIEYIKECLRYEDGKLYWKYRPREHFKNEQAYKAWNTKYSYVEAGTINTFSGLKRCYIMINRKLIFRYTIIWAIFNNEWRLNLDHEDRKSLNDKIDNLRPATQTQNMRNISISSLNTSGYKGVCWDKRKQKYYARIKYNKRYIFLGYFDEIKDAIEARRKAAKIYHGEFASDG